MLLIGVDDISDPRVEAYRNLKDRDVAREGGRFIAEGEHVVRRLLQSDYPVESLLVARQRVERLQGCVPDDVPVYLVDQARMQEIMGFHFHSGIIACGRRKNAVTLADVADGAAPLTLVICPEIINADNLGALIRISAALGVDGMILGPRSCDPFWRRAIRVSMGAVFSLPIYRAQDWPGDLRRLKDQYGLQLVGTVLDKGAGPLEQTPRPPRLGLLLGSEAQGLDAVSRAACDRLVTIPMQRGIDSLNVVVAAGIFLHHFTRQTNPPAA